MLLNNFQIDYTTGVPVYRQIIHQIHFLASTGILANGERLPTIRELTDHLKINPNTVAKAYRELEQMNIIESRRGCGSFITLQTSPQEQGDARKMKLAELFAQFTSEVKQLGVSDLELTYFLEKQL